MEESLSFIGDGYAARLVQRQLAAATAGLEDMGMKRMVRRWRWHRMRHDLRDELFLGALKDALVVFPLLLPPDLSPLAKVVGTGGRVCVKPVQGQPSRHGTHAVHKLPKGCLLADVPATVELAPGSPPSETTRAATGCGLDVALGYRPDERIVVCPDVPSTGALCREK